MTKQYEVNELVDLVPVEIPLMPMLKKLKSVQTYRIVEHLLLENRVEKSIAPKSTTIGGKSGDVSN